MKESFLVLTGDISGFTKVPPDKREKLLRSLRDLITSWASPAEAQIFRGDSFQMLFSEPREALQRSIQIRCWLKSNPLSDNAALDARIAIGIGEVTYRGKTVLDSDGEAFHLSGRAFDSLADNEHLRIVTADRQLNEQLDVICRLMDIITAGWTRSQAEVIFMTLETKTQQQIAAELTIAQSAVSNRLRLAKWTEVEKAVNYISGVLGQASCGCKFTNS